MLYHEITSNNIEFQRNNIHFQCYTTCYIHISMVYNFIKLSFQCHVLSNAQEDHDYL